MVRTLHFILLALGGGALGAAFSARKWRVLVFYTQLSNLAAAVSSLLLVIFGQTAAVAAVRYLAACMLTMTFLITVCVLVPMGGNPKKLLWSGVGLCHHLLCPILSTASYLLLERRADPGMLWLPVAVTFVYGTTMMALNAAGRIEGPYPFFRVKRQSPGATAAWMAALTGVITAIAAALIYL